MSSTHPLDESGLPHDDLVVTSRRSLLKAFDCTSVEHLEAVLDDQYEHSVQVQSDAMAADDGLEVEIGTRATQLEYPFAIGDIWSALNDLEVEDHFENECSRLADEIEEIEGFRVTVEIDHSFDTSTLRRRHQRRSLDSGVEVQHVDMYSFKRPMSDNASVGSWLEERFKKKFPGLEIRFDGHPDPDPDLSLGELRGK